MKKTSRILSLVFAFAMALSLISCSGDTSYIATFHDQKIPAGVYLYQLVVATQSAYSQVEDSTKDVLDQEIDGQDASVWIEQTAQQEMKRYLAVEKEFEELGLTLDTDAQNAVTSQVNSEWTNYGEWYEENGISKDSLNLVIQNLAKKQQVFLYYYDEGGPEAVSDDDLKAYFNENYVKIKYLGVSWDTTLEGDELTAAKEEAKAKAEEYLARAKNGESMDQLIQEYSNEQQLANAEDGEEVETTDPSEIEEDTYATILSKEGGTSFGEQFADRMKNMSAGDIEVVEGTSKYYVLAKYDILAKEDDFTSRRISLLQTMKGEEYEQKLDNVVNEMGITLNEAALKRYKAKKIKY